MSSIAVNIVGQSVRSGNEHKLICRWFLQPWNWYVNMRWRSWLSCFCWYQVDPQAVHQIFEPPQEIWAVFSIPWSLLIWRFPEMGVTSNHPFKRDVPLQTIIFGPNLWKPPFLFIQSLLTSAANDRLPEHRSCISRSTLTAHWMGCGDTHSHTVDCCEILHHQKDG